MAKMNALIKGAPGALMVVSPVVELVTTLIEQGRHRERESTRRMEIAAHERMEIAKIEQVRDELRRLVDAHAGERTTELSQLLMLAVHSGDQETTQTLTRAIVDIVRSPMIPRG